jgi:hypothetical protein
MNENVQFLTKLTKDVINFKEITKTQVRFLVETYYDLQKDRIRNSNQCFQLNEAGTPSIFHEWLTENFHRLEKNIEYILRLWVMSDALGERLMSVCGIGPILSAGLLAYIDFDIAISAASVWRFAGLDPTIKWEKGQKRPFNAGFKTLCWKIGESFVKVKSNDKDFYGKIYTKRRSYEEAKNERGDYKDIADECLKRFSKTTECYKSYVEGKLPKAHLYARAKRYTVKLFLSHIHELGYEMKHGKKPPFPFEKFPIHTHKIEIPF